MGDVPVSGIPLPLMSAGGSNMISVFMMLGLVNNVRLRVVVKRFCRLFASGASQRRACYRFEPAIGCAVIARESGASSVFKFSDQPAELIGGDLPTLALRRPGPRVLAG